MARRLIKAPINLSASENGSGQIDLRWIAPNNKGIIGYKIERKSPTDVNFVEVISNTKNTNTSYPDTELRPNTKYSYRVSALTSTHSSPPSNIATATTDTS